MQLWNYLSGQWLQAGGGLRSTIHLFSSGTVSAASALCPCQKRRELSENMGYAACRVDREKNSAVIHPMKINHLIH